MFQRVLRTAVSFVEPHRLSRPPLRRHAASLFFVVAVSMLTLACGTKEITKVKTQQEALEIVDVLYENGLEAKKEETGEGAKTEYKIVIGQSWFSEDNVLLATRVLRDNGLPRPEAVGGEGAFQNQGFVSPESAQVAQRLKERETEIERQLLALPNVIKAEVNIVMGEDSAFNFQPYPASATVLILHKEPKFSLSDEQVQNLVAGSVANLRPEKVAVALAQKQVRPVSRGNTNTNRYTNLLIAGGAGLVILLAALFAIFFLQSRRQRKQIDALQHEVEDAHHVAPDAIADTSATIPDAVLTPDHRWLASETNPRPKGSEAT